jgi:hypothetical protein
LIKSQLLYQLSYPRLHFPHARVRTNMGVSWTWQADLRKKFIFFKDRANSRCNFAEVAAGRNVELMET